MSGKFAPTNETPEEIIEKMKSVKKKEDAYILLELLKRMTDKDPIVWHPGIIGYGKYAYEYETGISGVAPVIAFAPRQNRFSIYLTPYLEDEAFEKLGKHQRGKSCLYINKLADVNRDVLEDLITTSMNHTHENYDIIE